VKRWSYEVEKFRPNDAAVGVKMAFWRVVLVRRARGRSKMIGLNPAPGRSKRDSTDRRPGSDRKEE
jgi:hypothetical protein